mmetsp:Transcript_17426/g.35561  ORF Transcript_17426/g.35561 Transcript_17426/m.35561 type:complete len:361 (+) Transcript_17426:260-1342(+)
MSLLKTVRYRTQEELEKNSPSLKPCNGKAGLNLATIKRLHALGAKAIHEVGQKLQYPVVTTATAVFYYHRFYAEQHFQEHDRLQVATACLFLSGKVEDTPKPLKVVITEMYTHRFKKDLSIQKRVMDDATTYNLVKDRVLVVERSLLYTIGFDFNVDQSYVHSVHLRQLTTQYLDHRNPEGKGDNKRLADYVLQAAFNLINDSQRLTLCLQFPASQIGIACFYLAMKLVLLESRSKNDGKPTPLLGGGRPLYEFFTDILNYVEVSPRGLTPSQREKYVSERLKERNERFKVASEDIHKMSKQIISMYERQSLEEGEILTPVKPHPPSGAVKRERPLEPGKAPGTNGSPQVAPAEKKLKSV